MMISRSPWVVILVGTLLRLAAAGTFSLVPDEAYYWQWSRYLDWSYHDHPPLIAWSIYAATAIMGHTELAVRLPAVLAMAIVSAYLVAFALRWYGERVAFHAALLTQSVLLFNAGGLLATPDCMQAAAWAGAAYHVARAYEEGTTGQWLLGGLWFGMGMLGKLSMGLFLPCAYLYGLFSPAHRHRLMTVRPYAGVLCGLLLFTPVVYWNAARGWASFRHVAYQGGAKQAGFVLKFHYLGDFLISQVALLSPLVFILVIAAWWQPLRSRLGRVPWIDRYIWFTSVPVFIVFTLLSLTTRIEGNWAATAYFTVCVLAADLFSRKHTRKHNRADDTETRGSRPLWRWTVGTSLAFTLTVLIQIWWPFLPVPPRADRITQEIAGWAPLGARAGQMLEEMPDPEHTFFFGLNYQTASELAFYTPDNPRTVSLNKGRRPNAYDGWIREEQILGRDGIGVTRHADDHKGRLLDFFQQVEPPVEVRLVRKRPFPFSLLFENPEKTFYLYRAHGFKGGVRWVPEDPDDIRKT